jgi:cellulose synthase operon protein C
LRTLYSLSGIGWTSVCIRRKARDAGVAFCLILLLSGCGQRKPEEQLAAAQLSLDKDDPRTAVIELKAALARKPTWLEARILLGRALLKSGDLAGAQIEFRKAMDGGARPQDVVPAIASLMLLRNEVDRLILEFADTELSDAVAHGELKSVLATAYGLKGKHQLAAEAGEGQGFGQPR